MTRYCPVLHDQRRRCVPGEGSSVPPNRSVADPLLLVCSALLTMFAIISISFIFVPLMVLVRGEPGFYNGIRPLGMLFSGFLFRYPGFPRSFSLWPGCCPPLGR